jgi:hypothetical protein
VPSSFKIKGDPIMRLRSPNVFFFLLALVLVVVGVLQYLGIPIKIPQIPGVAIPKAITEIPGLPEGSAFWILFCGWLLLFVASVGSRRGAKAASRGAVVLDSVEPGALAAEAKA